MPAAGVAQAVNQAIANFKATNPSFLKQIDVVIYEQKMLNDFKTVVTGSASTASSIPLPTSLSQNGVIVNVTGGDVLTCHCDVLINTTGANFDLTGTF